MMLHKVKFKKRRSSRTPSTFTLSRNPHSTNNKLHSKSTYFYRWGSRLNYVIPSVCALALLVGGIITINPILNGVESVFADGEDGTETSTQASTAPTVSLKLTRGDAYQETPAEVGKIKYRSNIFTISGSNIGHYTISLNTASGKTGELVGKDNKYATVGKVATNTTSANFEDNTWGYAVSTRENYNTITDANMTYNPVPSGMDSVNNSVELTKRIGIPKSEQVADSYKITFAAKLSGDLPSDHYEAEVYLSVVASPLITVTDITTMQEMTSSVCADSTIGATAKLKDTRDNKIYYVTKLKGDTAGTEAKGECWMTQNLAYNGGGDEQCKLNGGISCSGWPGSRDNKARYAVGTHIDSDHSSQGNFYSWGAAVNNDTSTTEPKQGVCPDGWQLPTSSNTNSRSFGSLTNAYGIGDDAAGSTALRADPLHFVYGGSLYGSQLHNAGDAGYYWSSTPSGSTNVFNLRFSSGRVEPSNVIDSRYLGYSVRCVAQ